MALSPYSKLLPNQQRMQYRWDLHATPYPPPIAFEAGRCRPQRPQVSDDILVKWENALLPPFPLFARFEYIVSSEIIKHGTELQKLFLVRIISHLVSLAFYFLCVELSMERF